MDMVENIINSHPFWKGLNPRYFHILLESADFTRFGPDQTILKPDQRRNTFI